MSHTPSVLTFTLLNSLFSKPRINSYLAENDTAERVLEKYHLNLTLSEAMMPSLHYLEILLRNRLDAIIGYYYGENWLIQPSPFLMISLKDTQKIEIITDKLSREGKRTGHDAILAQMTFGFWCSFFHKKYDPVIWHRRQALKTIFPSLPRHQRTRKYLEQKILKIKLLRNRIAHHEPVWKYKVSTNEAHALCCELVHAMSPEGLALLTKIDRFPAMWNGRSEGI